MSRKQLIIAIIVISLTCGLVFDTQREYKKTLTQDIENVYADYVDIKFSGYRFYTLDPIERFVKVSPNRNLKPGTYIVGETKDDNGHTYLNPGTLILKNEDYNEKLKISNKLIKINSKNALHDFFTLIKYIKENQLGSDFRFYDFSTSISKYKNEEIDIAVKLIELTFHHTNNVFHQ